MARMAGASTGAIEHGRAPAMLNTPRSFAAVPGFGRTSTNKRKVDGQVDPETEPADRHANEETVEIAGDGDHEQRQAIHDRRGKNEHLPSACPVREPATGKGRGDEDGGLSECAEEYLLRDLG